MKAAIFDMDGTLVDSMYYWRTVSLEFLRTKGIEPPRELCDRAYLMSVRDAPELFRQYYEFPYTEEEYNDTVNSIMFEHYRRDVGLKPYAAEYLEKLRTQGVVCALATATWRPVVMPLLEKLGVLRYFYSGGREYMVCRDELGMGKGSDEYYPLLCKKFGFKPENCVMYEDALYSMRTAKRAGLGVWAIADPTAQANLPEIRRLADRYVSGWKELVDEN